MIGVFPYLVKPGQYVKFRGHNIQDDLYAMWWKVTAVEGTSIRLVNRDGNTRRVPTTIRGVKAMIWEPGDDRADEILKA